MESLHTFKFLIQYPGIVITRKISFQIFKVKGFDPKLTRHKLNSRKRHQRWFSPILITNPSARHASQTGTFLKINNN